MTPNPDTAAKPTILVVDDEPLLLMIVAETLRDAGYNVREASTSDMAATVLKEPGDIDLLISDIKMPGLSGYQVVDLGMSVRPKLRVLLMTGYAQDPVPKRMAESGVQVLHKPFDFDTLPQLVRQILDKPG
jgi:DNA-binding NtrC family response regulator